MGSDLKVFDYLGFLYLIFRMDADAVFEAVEIMESV